MFKFYILLLLALVPHLAAAEIRDVQTWWALFATGNFYQGKTKTQFKYWLDGQQRMGEHSHLSTQRLIRPGLGYALSETSSVWLGAAWCYTGIPLTRLPHSERRIWQQFLWMKTYAQLRLSSRTRLEQRFLENRPDTIWRLREMVKMVSPFTHKPQFAFVGSDEVFVHHNKNIQGFDQNRFFVGIAYTINPTITTEIGYLNQYINRHTNDHFQSNNLSTSFLFNLS